MKTLWFTAFAMAACLFLVAPSEASVSLVYEYDAGLDPDGGTDNTWEASFTKAGRSGRNLSLESGLRAGPPRVDYQSSIVTLRPGLSGAYLFQDGGFAGGGNPGAATGPDRANTGSYAGTSVLGANTGPESSTFLRRVSSTWEVWFKPAKSSLSEFVADDDFILSETGGGNGVGIAFENVGGDQRLRLRHVGGSGSQETTYDLPGDDILKDFIQVVGVLDSENLHGDRMRLYVNGVLVDTSNAANPTAAWIGGGDEAGIGGRGAANMGGFGGGDSGLRSFDGSIALVSLYDEAMTDQEVMHRFTLVGTPEPTTLLIWSLLAATGIGLGWRRRK